MSGIPGRSGRKTFVPTLEQRDVVRYWDLAATEKTEFNDPDWTVGIKLGRDTNGGYWLLDVVQRTDRKPKTTA